MTNRKTLEANAGALWVHPSELTGQPWTPQDVVSTKAYAGLTGIEIALEFYELGVHPEVPVRAWPQIQADIDRLVRLHHHVVDYVATAGLAGSLADSTEVTTERDSDQACHGLDVRVLRVR